LEAREREHRMPVFELIKEMWRGRDDLATISGRG
jgi:hypothetical protein